MTLLRAHKVLVYALILLPALILTAGGEMNPVILAVFFPGLAVSWWWESPRIDPDRWARVLVAATLIVTGLAVLRLVQGGARIEPVVDLVLLLTVIKAFQRRRAADYTQLLALSFLLLTASSAFNQGLAFAVGFVVYLIAGTITLAVQHLHEELAEHHPAELSRFRPDTSMLATVGGLALVVCGFSIVFFLVFPRMGFGLFNRMGRDELMTSGFGDTVSLGEHGRIRSDESVVMRVRLSGSRSGEAALRWRGTALDTYDGRSWSRSDSGRANAFLTDDGFYLDPLVARVADGRTVVQDIYLEPISSAVLFGLDGFVAVRFPDEDPDLTRSFFREYVKVSAGGEFFLERSSASGVHYEAHSVAPRQPVRGALWAGGAVDFRNRDRARDGALDLDLERRYLQLPLGMSDRFGALAAEIVAGTTTPVERARAIEAHLRSEYQYTTDLPEVSPLNPVESFLFDTRRGHCEYFATAMVLLARQVGLPARNVNGFLGGDWNAIGGYYAVRQSHAHSWVEVYLPQTGWTTFDPTPAGGLPSTVRSGLWVTVSAFFDSLRMLWYQHVVDYDLEQQLGAVRGVVGLFGEGDNLAFDLRRLAFAAFRNAAVVLLGLLIWLMELLWLVRRGRRDLPWGWSDTLIGAGGLILTELVVLLFWRPDPTVRAAFLGAFLPLSTWLAAWAARQQPTSSDEQYRRRGRLHPASRAFLRLVRLLGRRGFDFGATDTPARLTRQARQRELPWSDQLAEVIALYERSRFGRPDDAALLAQLKRQARELGREIRRRRA